MITKFTIAANINIYEALILMDTLMLVPHSIYDASTKRHHKKGIMEFGVWINQNKFLKERYIRNCSMYAEINPAFFTDKETGKFQIHRVIDTMDNLIAHLMDVAGVKSAEKDSSDMVDYKIVKEEREKARKGVAPDKPNESKYSDKSKDKFFKRFEEIQWRVQNVSFKQDIVTEHVEQYMKLLNSGRSLKSIRMTKANAGKTVPEELVYENKSVSFHIVPDKNKKLLSFRLVLNKSKLVDMPKSDRYPINDRVLSEFVDKMELVEYTLWQYYLHALAGKGNYYSYERAEAIISDNKDLEYRDKKRMYSILKGVAVYKTVEDYFGAVGSDKAKKAYDFMGVVTSKSMAEKYIKMLEEKCEINPVVISRRYAKGVKEGKDRINGVTYLENLSHCVMSDYKGRSFEVKGIVEETIVQDMNTEDMLVLMQNAEDAELPF